MLVTLHFMSWDIPFQAIVRAERSTQTAIEPETPAKNAKKDGLYAAMYLRLLPKLPPRFRERLGGCDTILPSSWTN